MDYYIWKPYVPVAARRAQAAREAAKLGKKRPLAPVAIDGRKIAKTFWGKSWCDNLERYSDFANRLPRGRSYVRNGSVLDLQVAPGVVNALVSGSTLYRIEVKVAAVPKARWSAVCKDCAGSIDSLVELLQGRFSESVMTRICQEKTGLFPSPAEITFSCSCPDWASMCKHVAAVLYGIGARLDEKPDLLFALRKVNHQDLLARAGTDVPGSSQSRNSEKVLNEDDLAGMFGIEMAEAPPAPARRIGGNAGGNAGRKRTPRAEAMVDSGPMAVKPAKAARPAAKKPAAPGKAAGKRVRSAQPTSEQPTPATLEAQRMAFEKWMKDYRSARRRSPRAPR